MRSSLAITVALALTLRPALAERAPDDKSKADHVVTGVVEKVFSRARGRTTEHIVQLRVGKVEKGSGCKVGERFYVYCYQRKRDLLAFADDLGHTAIPKEGDTIKAYVHRRGGRFEGNFPDWFEAVKRAE